VSGSGVATIGSGLPHPGDVAERVLDTAGGSCIAIVEETHQSDVRFANNTVTTDGLRLDRRITAVRIDEEGPSVASGVASHSGDVDVVALVREAEAAMAPAEDAFTLVKGDADSSFDEDPAVTSMDRLGAVIDGLAPAFARAASDRTVLAGFANHTVVTTYLASTTGIRRRYVQPTGALQLVGRRDGASAWVGVGTPDFDDVSVDALETRVMRGLEWEARRIDVEPGRHEVVLPPSAVADLMIFLLDAVGGREAEEGRTVFSKPGGGTRVGETLSPMPFDLWSDPLAPGVECVPFLATSASSADVSVFDNGLPLARTDWIHTGRLGRLMYHRAGAARAASAPAAPIDNLLLALPGASGSAEDLVARTERGLLVASLWYIREVDPKTLLLTGLTRDGVYVIEDGAVVGAATNFRFNESPVDLLARATEVSATLRTIGRETASWMNRTAMPALRIPDFNMSTVSKAV
jgi:predicted Zn-dependent protease